MIFFKDDWSDDFTNQYLEFAKDLPEHIREFLPGAIGWSIGRDPEGVGTKISGDLYIAKNPEHIYCPEFFIIYRYTGKGKATLLKLIYDLD